MCLYHILLFIIYTWELISKMYFILSETSPDLTYCDEVCGADLDIEETSKGYRYVMEVPNAYYKYIIGKKAETKRRLETETRTQIIVPKPGEQKEEIGR